MGENCLPNILTIFYFGDKISYENVRGSHPAARKIEIMGCLCDSYFLDLSPSSFCLNYSEEIYPLSDTQCRTNVSSDRHFQRIPNNAHSACNAKRETKWEKSPKLFWKVEAQCHLGANCKLYSNTCNCVDTYSVSGLGWDQLLIIYQ